MNTSNKATLVLATVIVTAALCFRFPAPVAGYPQAERPETNEGRGRFELSTDDYGYTILDTHTGVVYRGFHGQKPKRVNDPL